MGTRRKINAVWWNIKINLQKLVDTCGDELPTNVQSFMQKDSTEVKILQKVLAELLFWKHPVEVPLILPPHANPVLTSTGSDHSW